MRKWAGFKSEDPRHVMETTDRYLREVDAAFRRISKGQGTASNAPSLSLAVTPPSTDVVTGDGSTATPTGRVAYIEETAVAAPATVTIAEGVVAGVYRFSFIAYASSLPTTSDLTVQLTFNGGDVSYAANALAMALGPPADGSCTIYCSGGDITCDISFTNSMTADYRLILEAL